MLAIINLTITLVSGGLNSDLIHQFVKEHIGPKVSPLSRWADPEWTWCSRPWPRCHRKELDGEAYREIRDQDLGARLSPWDFLMTALSLEFLLQTQIWQGPVGHKPKLCSHQTTCLLGPLSSIYKMGVNSGALVLTSSDQRQLLEASHLHPAGLLPSAHPPAHRPQSLSPHLTHGLLGWVCRNACYDASEAVWLSG